MGKVVSVYFALECKAKSNRIGLMEGDRLLSQGCFTAGWALRVRLSGSEEWCLEVAVACLQESPFKAEAQGAKS